MPSILVWPQSGGMLVLSGSWFSGRQPWPVGGIAFKAAITNSGAIYIALSGNMTVNSGGGNFGTLSGGAGSGLMDGMPLYAGNTYPAIWGTSIPELGVNYRGQFSGNYQIYASCDAACSGQARLYWEGY